MSQVVDLGYVVGPTGPKGDDATLPQTEKVTVYVGAPITKSTTVTYEYKITYVSDRQVNTVTIQGTVDTSADAPNLEDFTPITTDYGSVALVRTYRNSLDGYEETSNGLYFFDVPDMTGWSDDNHNKTPCVYQRTQTAFLCVYPVAALIEILI